MDTPKTKETLLALLKEHNIQSKSYDHPRVLTVEEQAKYVGHLEGGHSKNLLLKDKKNRLILVSALTTTKIDLKLLSQRLGLGKSGLRMAPEDVMQAALKVPLGCVTPFALLNESARSVVLLLDNGFRRSPQVFFHPLSNESTTAVSPDGLDKYLKLIGREPTYVNLEEEVSVGKDQPPDLARFLGDLSGENEAKELTVTEINNAQAARTLSNNNKVSAKSETVAKPKPKANSASGEAPVKQTRADVPVVTATIIDEFLSVIQKQVKAESAEKFRDISGTSMTQSLKKYLEPEIESLLTVFKNTAYTEGFVAGLASGSHARPPS